MDALTLLLCFLGLAITDNDIFGDDLIEQVRATSQSHIRNVHFQGTNLVFYTFLHMVVVFTVTPDFQYMKNELQPTLATFSRNFRCEKAAQHQLSNFFPVQRTNLQEDELIRRHLASSVEDLGVLLCSEQKLLEALAAFVNSITDGESSEEGKIKRIVNSLLQYK